MRQFLADIKGKKPFRLSIRAQWAREGAGVLVGVVIVLVGWLVYQQIQLWNVNNHTASASERAKAAASASYAASVRASATAASACESAKVVASIASDTLATQITNSRALLPKISFPGLTHKQLVALTKQKESEERRHLDQLRRVSKNACPTQSKPKPPPLRMPPILPPLRGR